MTVKGTRLQANSSTKVFINGHKKNTGILQTLQMTLSTKLIDKKAKEKLKRRLQ